jgi:hypothetical protein
MEHPSALDATKQESGEVQICLTLQNGKHPPSAMHSNMLWFLFNGFRGCFTTSFIIHYTTYTFPLESPDSFFIELQNIGKSLSCPLCLSTLRIPTLLPCNHAFCRSCLLSSFDPKHNRTINPTSGKSTFRNQCAICKSS